MRLLLISDTHGELGLINEAIAKTRADAVIHAGDFGFYDKDSAARLSDRELALRIRHSDVSKHIRKQAFSWSREQKLAFIDAETPLSELPHYLTGDRQFDAPVYAVWGNHEDLAVLDAFQAGRYKVPNLTILSERSSYRVGRFRVFGLGGNFIKDERLFEAPRSAEGLSGVRGKVWATLEQLGRLAEHVRGLPEALEVRLFVSHVSPGKESLIERYAAHLGAHFHVSGHMGSPYPMVWNGFATRPDHRPDDQAEDEARALAELRTEDLSGAALEAFKLLQSRPERMRLSRRGEQPWWFRGQFSLNLPDAKYGWMVLDDDGEKVQFESSASGLRFCDERDF